MKIAVFTETYHPQTNGVVTFLSDMLPLISKNNEVVLFAPGGKKLRTEKVKKNLKIYWVPANEFPFYEDYRMSKIKLSDIERILKKEKPDVVHLHAPVLMGLEALYVSNKLGLPVIATYHTHFPDYVPHLFKGLLPKRLNGFTQTPVKKMIEYVFSKADITTAPTKELKNELESYGIKNVLYVPNGVAFKKFKKADKESFIKKYRIPSNKPVVLYVGRVSFEKKIDCLIRAFKKLPKATLVIVGKGPSLENYKQLAESIDLENVVFTGYVPDELLPSAYACADVFVSPSDTETFGLTFVEAMYFGLPVVGTDRLGAKEVINDGKNGFLVKPDDEGALAAKISKLLKSPPLRRKLGSQGKKDAKKYNMERISAQFMKLYRKSAKQ